MLQIASVCELVSWLTQEEDDESRKAKTLTAAAISRASFNHSLATREVKVNSNTLIVGGGVTGIVKNNYRWCCDWLQGYKNLNLID
jgi:heterodisulfide reductase subunit A-like polyferredoxin